MGTMKLFNNTPNDVFYGISSANSGDCGTINAGETADLPYYDNQQNVQVDFAALPASPSSVSPFVVTIPSSGTGMAVTIGLYQE
jgi:hypothetical protein